MPDIPAAVRELEVAILHTLVLDRIFAINPDEVRKGGSIEYTIDGRLARWLRSPRGGPRAPF